MIVNYCYMTPSGKMITISDVKLIRDSSESFVKFTAVIDNCKFANLLELSEYLADPVNCNKLSILSNTASLPPVYISDVNTAIRWYLDMYIPEHDNSYLSLLDLIRLKYHDIKFLLIDRETNIQLDQCHCYNGLVNLMYYRAAYDKHSSQTNKQYYIDFKSFYSLTDEAQAIIHSIHGTAADMYSMLTNSLYSGAYNSNQKLKVKELSDVKRK